MQNGTFFAVRCAAAGSVLTETAENYSAITDYAIGMAVWRIREAIRRKRSL